MSSFCRLKLDLRIYQDFLRLKLDLLDLSGVFFS